MYNSLNEYLKNMYGEKVYKLSLSANVTCPNRDGTCGTKGCIFCSEGGSGEFSSSPLLPIKEQIKIAKNKVKNKTKSNKFIAYFQSFTNTYASADYLNNIFMEAITEPEIVGLSIATRPDCLPDDMIDMIDKLNKIKPVWVELGLQSIHQKTAQYIRRGYNLAIYDDAVKKLRKINVHIVTHVIIGIPYETKNDILESVKYIGNVTDGIKLQLLHVLKNTDLETDYNNKLFNVLSLEEYIDILCDCVELLPKNVVIHRLTGDGDKKILIAPQWSSNKKLVLNKINKEFIKRNIQQGKNAK